MITGTEIRNRAEESIDYSFHPGKRPDVLVILGHGLTGNKDRPLIVALAEGLSELGWPCLRISFTGNGDSEGRFADSCISKGIRDLQAVLDMVPPDVGVIYAGHSMGAAVGVLTAARDLRIRGLISLAGMTHTAEFAARDFAGVTPDAGVIWEDENFPLSLTLVNDLNWVGSTLSAAEAVTQPWLLIHGAADDVVPIQDGRDAFAAATCEKQWLEIASGGHSFDEFIYPQIVETVDHWLKANFGGSTRLS